jgi:hypothetical protein
MSDSGNRVVVQEGYLLPFQAYRPRRKRIGSNLRTREPVYEKASRRGHGPKSAAYKAQQNKMQKCAARWRGADSEDREAGYRKFMSGCLKSKG